jgi:hypothetical protein
VLAGLLLVLLAAGGALFRALSPIGRSDVAKDTTTSPRDPAAHGTRGAVRQGAPRTRRVHALEPASTPGDQQTVACDGSGGARPSTSRELHEILRESLEELDRSADRDAGSSARRRVAWVVDQVLEPYRRDRAYFASVYRWVRFGDGELRGRGGSLVRELRFRDASERITALRPHLETWCYDELAIRLADRLRQNAELWEWWRRECRKRSWPEPPSTVDTGRGGPDAVSVVRESVLPHLADIPRETRVQLGFLFLELGDANAAQACHETRTAAALEQIRELREEIAALDSFPGTADRSVPVTVEPESRLAAWFAKHRGSLLAHAVGSDGPVELGVWDDEMTASFLAGGLPWAPEQWEVERRRLAAVVPDVVDRIHGHSASSPRWRVFTDVSADFAAQATLVLEAAFNQAQDGLGLPPAGPVPIEARIYEHRRDYAAITHDTSSGHWIARLNAVLTFLDDPDRTDFETFRYPTLVHEATHAALSRCLRHEPPSWMHEGLACFVQRWDPTRSVELNRRTTHDWVRNRAGLERLRDQRLLPPLDELCRHVTTLNVDDFGMKTSANYAAAASFFVYLAGDDERWETVRNWLDAVRNGLLPSLPPRPQSDDLEKGWRDFVDYECGRLAGAR